MGAVLLKLLNMSIAAGWLILAVIALRLLLRKAPKFLRCALWALAAVRLVCPFSIESALSLIPSAETVPQSVLAGEPLDVRTGVDAIDTAVNGYLGDAHHGSEALPESGGADVMEVLGWVWLAGAAAMLAYALISYLRLRKKVGVSLRLRDNIYICDDIKTPFILGVIRPKIYLPSDMDGARADYVTAHEEAHLKRRDHLWKPLGFLLLAAYWFNPLVWLAYILLCRDIELACDERVISRLGSGEKRAYSEALLSCAAPRRAVAACPLAFGEVGVKERIRSVLSYKKPAFWIIIAAVAACAAVALCFLTDPREAAGGDESAAPYDAAAPGQAEPEAFVWGSTVFMNPLSSYFPVGTTGYRYLIDFTGEGAFSIVDEESGETYKSVDGVSSEWAQLTKEEWSGLFIFGSAPDISGYGKPLVNKLSEEYYLFNMDGALWLGNYNDEKSGMWSVYELTPYVPSESDASAGGAPAQVTVSAGDIPGLIAALPDFNWRDAAPELISALYDHVDAHELSREQYDCVMRGTAGLDGAYAEGYGAIVDLLMMRDPYTVVWCYDGLTAEKQAAVLPFIVSAYTPESSEDVVLAWMDDVRASLAVMESVPLSSKSGDAGEFAFDMGGGNMLGIAAYDGGLPISLSGFHGSASDAGDGWAWIEASCRSLGLVLRAQISPSGDYSPWEVSVSSPARFPTAAGVAVGDGEEDILAAYGDAARRVEGEDSNNSFGHYDLRYVYSPDAAETLTFYLYEGAIYLMVAEREIG